MTTALSSAGALITVFLGTFHIQNALAAGFEWVTMDEQMQIPMKALVGGTGHGGTNNDGAYIIYIGRAHHNYELIPGKIDAAFLKGVLYVVHEGNEYTKKNYEILVGDDEFYWKKMYSGSSIPSNAINGGHKSDGTPYFIGRVKYDGRDKIIGKVDGSTKLLYTSRAKKGKSFPDYEILVWNDTCTCPEIFGSVG